MNGADSAQFEGPGSLEAHGLSVQRGSCPGAACAACLDEVECGLRVMLQLPGTLAGGPPTRHFLPVAIRLISEPPTHRRDFRLALEAVEPVLRPLLSRAGPVLRERLGPGAELIELTVIQSLPGAGAQAWHGDSEWSAAGPRMCTVLLCLHDLLEPALGPTGFCPDTHAPRCFPDGCWAPPTEAGLAEREPVWFGMCAGDAVLMDALCWHRGGANTSDKPRTLLSATFVQGTAGKPDGLMLDDFL